MHVFQGVCFKMSPECTVFQLKSTPTFYPRGPELRALDGRTRSPDESGAKTVHSEDILQSGRKNRAFRGGILRWRASPRQLPARNRASRGGILIGIVFAEAVNQRKTVHPGNIPSGPRRWGDATAWSNTVHRGGTLLGRPPSKRSPGMEPRIRRASRRTPAPKAIALIYMWPHGTLCSRQPQ